MGLVVLKTILFYIRYFITNTKKLNQLPTHLVHTAKIEVTYELHSGAFGKNKKYRD